MRNLIVCNLFLCLMRVTVKQTYYNRHKSHNYNLKIELTYTHSKKIKATAF